MSLSCLVLALTSVFFSPTGIGIGATPGDRSKLPTDGKVGERPAPVTALALSNDERALLVGDSNGRLRRFALSAGALGKSELLPWKDGRQAGAIEVILVLPGRTWLALDDGTIARANADAIVAQGRHPEGVTALVTGPEGRLASAGQNGEVRIYDAQGALQSTILAHRVSAVALASEPGKTPRLWSLGWDGRLCAWSWPRVSDKQPKVGSKGAGHAKGSGRSRKASAPKLSKPRFVLDLGPREPTTLTLVPVPEGARGKDALPRLLVGDFQGRVRRVDLVGRRLKETAFPVRANLELVTQVVISPDGKVGVALASAEQLVLGFDPRDASLAPRVLHTSKVPPARAVFLDAETLAVGFYDGSVQLVKVTQ